MPTNKQAVFRHRVLDKLLSDRYHYYTMKELTDLCNRKLSIAGFKEVKLRTIEKDIVYLREGPYRAPIVNVRREGASCYYYKKPNFTLFKKVVKPMSDEEEALLAGVLQTIGQFDGLPNFEWLDRMRSSFKLDESRRIISFSNNPYLKNSNMLAGLFSAIAHKQVIELHYHPEYKEEEHMLLLHPYLLKQYNNNWFLFGAVDSDGFIMNQPLDRIERFEPRPDKKYRDCPEELEERFEDIVGVTFYQDRPVDSILLWASDKTAPRLDAKPIHSSHVRVKSGDAELRQQYPQFGNSGSFFRYSCIRNFELKRELISYLDGLVVLEPQDLRDEIKELISNMNDNYSK